MRFVCVALKRRGRDATGFDLAGLAAASEGFSGAEIEQSIVAGLYTAFGLKQQLSTEILLAELRSTQPLSTTRAEDIDEIRAWAKNRAVQADLACRDSNRLEVVHVSDSPHLRLAARHRHTDAIRCDFRNSRGCFRLPHGM